MEYLVLSKIDAYVTAYALGNDIWDIVSRWSKFDRWSLGMQITRSADSISANIAEGFGRFHKKDKIRFYRYSFGSMEETRDWLRKARDRSLIPSETADQLMKEIDKLPLLINQRVRYTDQKLKY